MVGAMQRTVKAALGVAAALGVVGRGLVHAETARPDPPPPASLENHDVEAWAATYLHTEGWTLLTHDQEGAHLGSVAGVRKTAGGLVEADIRTELFQPVTVGPGPARSGVARWAVDCDGKRLAVLSMTIYSHNNLTGELARKPPSPPTWQAPVESELVTISVICGAAKSGKGYTPKPLVPASPS